MANEKLIFTLVLKSLQKFLLKKTVTILLLSIIFFGQIGYYFCYLIKQEMIKESVETELLAGLPDAVFELVIADENNAAFSWKEEGREFTLNGELYDVAKTKLVNGKIILLAVKDAREEALIKQFVKDVDNVTDNKCQGKSNKQLFKFQLNELMIFGEDEELFFAPMETNIYDYFNMQIVNEILDLSTPPPKC